MKIQQGYHHIGDQGRSTTAHIVLDLRALIWGFGESCRPFTAYNFTTGQYVLKFAL